MTAFAMDVRELSQQEIDQIAGGEEASTDAKIAATVGGLVAGALLTLVVPLPVQVFLIVAFTPSPAY